MDIIAHRFYNPPPGVIKIMLENEIKKMSMLRRQEWMTDDNELDSQRVLGLSAQYEKNQYVEEFTKQCNVVYLWKIRLRRGRRFKIFFGRYMELISGRSFTKQHKPFLQGNDKLY